MAEPLDRSQRIASEPASTPLTAAMYPSSVAPEEVYRTLCIPALVGFGMAAVFSALIVAMAVVGLFTSRPLILGVWTIAIPIAALGVCLAARSAIKASAGTLAGEELVRWGIRLALFVGVGYWAYYAAVYFAVRQQAAAFADAWLEQVIQGESAKVAFNMIPPLKRIGLRQEDPNLARELHQRLMMEHAEDQPFDMMQLMSQNDIIGPLAETGKTTTFVRRGVRSFKAESGGFEVVFDYEIVAPDGTHDLQIAVQGMTAPNNEFERRQWFVDLNPQKSKLRLAGGKPRNMERGLTSSEIYTRGMQYLMGWLKQTRDGSLDSAFLLSLPFEERMDAVSDMLAATQLEAAAGPFAVVGPGRATMEKYGKYLDGGLVQVDPKSFITSDRDEVTALVRSMFSHAYPELREFKPAEATPVRGNDGLKLRFQVETGRLESFHALCAVEIEGDPAAIKDPKASINWRIVGVHVLKGRLLDDR